MTQKILLLLLLSFSLLSFSQQLDEIDENVEQIEDLLFSYKINEALEKIDYILLSKNLKPDIVTRVKVLRIEALVKSELFDSGLKLTNELLDRPFLKNEYKIEVLLMRALLYEHIEDFENSFKDLKLVADLYSKYNIQKDQNYGVYLFRLASWYRLNGNSDLSIKYAIKAKELGKKYDYKQVVGTSYMLLGLTHEPYLKKKRFFEDALKVYKSYDDLNGIAAMYNSLARLELEQQQTSNAKIYNDSLFKLVTLTNNSYFLGSAFLLKSKTFELESKYDSSLIYFKQFHEAKLNEIYNERKLYVKELQFQLEMENEKLENEKLQQELEVERVQKNYWTAAGVGLLFLIGVSFSYLVVLFRKNKKIKFQTSEIYLTNKSLKSSLAEKEILLKEIFHRVKNNLALIHSLISFQIDDVEDVLVKEKFESLESRVKAISIAHQQFIPATLNNLSRKYDLQEYLETIAASYKRTDGRELNFQVSIAPIKLNLDKAMPIGILINELLSNSIKHVKTKNSHLEIYLKLIAEGNIVHLEYRDNGVIFNDNRQGSLGLFIIESMVQQLKGEINRHGSKFNITLKI